MALENIIDDHNKIFENYKIISTRYNLFRDTNKPGLFTPWNAKIQYRNGEEDMGLTQTLKSATLGTVLNIFSALYETGAIFGSGTLYLYNKVITKDESVIQAHSENTLKALMSAPYYLASFILNLAFDILSIVTRTASSLFHYCLSKMESSSENESELDERYQLIN